MVSFAPSFGGPISTIRLYSGSRKLAGVTITAQLLLGVLDPINSVTNYLASAEILDDGATAFRAGPALPTY